MQLRPKMEKSAIKKLSKKTQNKDKFSLRQKTNVFKEISVKMIFIKFELFCDFSSLCKNNLFLRS